MNQFRNVCDGCPLRTKVDVGRAREWCTSWGSDGVHSQLSDGYRRYAVGLYDGDVCDSDTAQDVKDDVQARIDACDSPKKGLLLQECKAGLARAWNWTEAVGTYTPNIVSPEEIIPLLGAADWRDAMPPHLGAGAIIFGDSRSLSELDLPYNSAFSNLGITKLTKPVRGTGAKLKRGKAVMLDRVSWFVSDGDNGDTSLENVFRIRVAQGGPHFAFRSDIVPDHGSSEEQCAKDIKEIFAKGIYTYLFSDAKAIKESNALIAAAQAEANQYSEEARRKHEITRRVLRDPQNWRNMN